MRLLEMIQHKLPGLEVNALTNRISIENGGAVLQINGRPVSFDRIRSLNIDNILRIEYTNISDIRYGLSVMGVINFVTKPASRGGNLMLEVGGSLSRFGGKGGFAINHGKSEWTLDYNGSYYTEKEYMEGGEERYIRERLPDIQRSREPLPALNISVPNNLTLGYTYMRSPLTMFSATLTAKAWTKKNESRNHTVQIIENAKTDYITQYNNKRSGVDPRADIYFRHNFTPNSKIETNLYGNVSTGKYDNELIYEEPQSYSLLRHTDNKSWRAGSEVVYTHTLENNMDLSGGINYFHNVADNVYLENSNKEQKNTIQNDNAYLHASVSGKMQKLSYSVGVGGKYQATTDGTHAKDAFKVSGKGTLNYQFRKGWTMNYLFMYSPYMPGLAAQTDVVRRANDLMYSVGNNDLDASAWMRNRMYLRYANKQGNVSIWASHTRNIRPIYNRVTYITDPESPYHDRFMMQSVNGESNDTWNLELNLTYTGVKNLQITTKGGWSRFVFPGFGDIPSLDQYYGSAWAVYNLKNWNFSAYYETVPQYEISGNTLSTRSQAYSSWIQYHWKDFWFTAGVVNPFAKKGNYSHRRVLSPVHPSSSFSYIGEASNMFVLMVTYRTNFGQQLKKAKKGLSNQEVDLGIGG